MGEEAQPKLNGPTYTMGNSTLLSLLRSLSELCVIFSCISDPHPPPRNHRLP